MAVQTFVLPDLGEGLTEAEVVRWLVAVGDEVVVDQPVVEVETAKSIVEVPSPYAGRVSELHGAEGGTVAVGSPLISVEGGLTVAPEPAQVAAAQYREEEKAGSGNVLIGYGTPEGSGSGRRRRPRAPHSATGEPNASAQGRVPRVTSPLVRRLAREAGVPILGITGTGVDGLITRRDVQAAIDATAPQAERQTANRTGLEVAQRTPMSGFRKAVSAAAVAQPQRDPRGDGVGRRRLHGAVRHPRRRQGGGQARPWVCWPTWPGSRSPRCGPTRSSTARSMPSTTS